MSGALLDTITQQLRGAVIEHQMPGRLRLRIRPMRGDTAYFRRLVALISECPAVEEITANPKTGGVLIRHSLKESESQRLIGLVGKPAPAALDGGCPKRSLRPVRHEEVAAACLQLLSVWQLRRGRLFGSAVEHLWHAYQVHRLEVPHLPAVLAALALKQLAGGRLFPPAATMVMYSLYLRRTSPPVPRQRAGVA